MRVRWLWPGLALLVLVLLKIAASDWYRMHSGAGGPAVEVVCPAGGAVCPLPDGSRLRFLDMPGAGRPFALALEGAGPAEPRAEFGMRGMEMGFNRYRFVRANGRWEARVTLPVCFSGRHDWVMTLILPDRRYRLLLKSE